MKCNLLFLNGWAAKPDIFTPFINALRDYIDKVLIIDWYDSKHSSYDRIHNMVGLLSETQPKRPTLLVGWSSGTMPILSYLGSDSINTSVIGALVFGATARFVNSNTPDYNFGWHKQILEQMITNFDENNSSVIDAFSSKAMSASDKAYADKAEAFQVCFQARDLTEINAHELKTSLEYLAHSDVRMKVQKILHPLLIIAGEKDRICSLKCSEWIADNSQNTTLHVIEDSGHAPHYFHAEECAELTISFIEDLIKT